MASLSPSVVTLSPFPSFLPASTTTPNGWKSIDVFFGNSSQLVATSEIDADFYVGRRWFAQARQDELVVRLLRYPTGGYFVDLAANDAVKISNTFALERDYHWRGLCIEPNARYWWSLAHRQCHVIGAVVGRQRLQEVQFKFPNRAAAQGGIVGFDNAEASRFGEDAPRLTVRLEEILERYNAPAVIDYLSLDVEGAETFVLETFRFERYRFRIITVERPTDELKRLLTRHGYVELKQLKRWGETLWAHELEQKQLDWTALDLDTAESVYKQPKAKQ